MKTKIITMVGFGLVSALALTSCSDSFLEDKKSYDKVTGDLYNTYEGAELRIDDIYARNLPSANSGASWRYPSSGTADDQSKSTEEYSGFGAFVNYDTTQDGWYFTKGKAIHITWQKTAAILKIKSAFSTQSLTS